MSQQDPNQVQRIDVKEVQDKKALPAEGGVDVKEQEARAILDEMESAQKFPEVVLDESMICKNVSDRIRRYETDCRMFEDRAYADVRSIRYSSSPFVKDEGSRKFEYALAKIRHDKKNWYISLMYDLKGTVSPEAWRIKLATFLNPHILDVKMVDEIYKTLAKDESEFAVQVECELIGRGYFASVCPFWNKIRGKNTDYANKIRRAIIKYILEDSGKAKLEDLNALIDRLDVSADSTVRQSFPEGLRKDFEAVVKNEKRACYKTNGKLSGYEYDLGRYNQAEYLLQNGRGDYETRIERAREVDRLRRALPNQYNFYFGLFDDLKDTVSDEAWGIKLRSFLNPNFLNKKVASEIYKKLENDESEFAAQIELNLISRGYVEYGPDSSRYAFWNKISGKNTDYANKIRRAILSYVSGKLDGYSKEVDNAIVGLQDGIPDSMRESLPKDLFEELDRIHEIVGKNIVDELDRVAAEKLKEKQEREARMKEQKQKTVDDMNEVLDERLADDIGVYGENESNVEDRLHVIKYIFQNISWADDETGVSIIEKLFDFLAKWQDSVYFKDEFQYRLHGYLDQLSRRGLKDGALVERLNKLLSVDYFHARSSEINKGYEFGYHGYSYKRTRKVA
ncbi:MAG: hypothetical protein US89_C0002G0011 [Candidatus Peregrinibacteria bacterium GW2011_GWF2_38_29]|nr:MAG: hypothetical protein US89_C0002G0011 [Candidatus Peregrinibacteria bacterium GW2011_GWF2_38_29]HBB02167.1 hypothetical protein [Candidatus Peregrinibacteria bacterium]